MERGAHLTVSSCLATGKEVVQGPGQVYLAGEEEGKGTKTGCSGRPGKHQGDSSLGACTLLGEERQKSSHLWLEGG